MFSLVRASTMSLAFVYGLLSFSASAYGKLAELLILDEDKGFKPLELSEAKVTYDVDLTTVRATYDLVFTSRRDNVTEGTFYFALPRGSYVHDFGMYVDGNYQSAAIVEAKAGRVAYEAMVRRGIDPALVEWTAGNSFKMRVFPIVEGKPTRVVMTVGMPLTMVSGNLQVDLPLDLGKVETLSLEVKGRLYSDKLPSLAGIKGLKIKEEKSLTNKSENIIGFSGLYVEKQMLLPEILSFVATELQKNKVKVRREDSDDSRFFEAHAFLDLPIDARPAPEKATIFWDYSFSSEKQSEERLAALSTYLSARKPKQIEIWGFNQQVFSIATGIKFTSEKAVLDLLRSKRYDGGTRIDRLMSKLTAMGKTLTIGSSDLLIFTDGIDSFELFDFAKPKSMAHENLNAYVIAPSVNANQTLLQLMSETFDAVVLQHDTELSASAFVSEPWHVKGVDAGKGLTKVLAGTATTVFPGSGIAVRGQIKKDGDATVTINMTQKGKSKTIKWSFDTTDAVTSKTKVIPRLWAQEQILKLAAEKRNNAEEIKNLGVTHQLASPYTVMVVLEWCDDYEEYKIPAPKDCRSRPKPTRSLGDFFGSLGGGDDEFEDEMSEDSESVSAEEGSSIEFDASDIGGLRRAPLGSEPALAESSIPAAPPSSPALAAPPSSPYMEDSVALEDMAEESDEGYSGGLPEETPKRELGFEAKLVAASTKSAESLYTEYLKIRPLYAKIPYYFVFTADLLTKAKRADLADLVLANVVEIRPGEARWLRIYAYKLISWGKASEAVAIYKAVSELREEDPQSFRDFGLALEAVGQPVLALTMYEKVYKGKWDSRLEGMSRIIQNDLARASRKVSVLTNKGQYDANKLATYIALDKRSSDGIVVTLSWDTDSTDIDLHVTEPNKTHIYYGNKEDENAYGKLSWDSTQGFGPEQYRVSRPMAGVHKVFLTYFSNNPVATSDGTFARVDIAITRNGVTEEQTKTLFLKDGREVVSVIDINFDSKQVRPMPIAFKTSLSKAKEDLAKGKFANALSQLDAIGIRKDRDEEGLRLFTRARVLAKLKRFPEAETANQRAVTLNPELIEAHYNNACIAALLKQPSKAATHLQLLIDSLDEDSEKAEKFLKLMDKDPDLASIRGTGMFKKLRAQMQLAH